MGKIVLCKDTMNNTIIEYRCITETENIKYSIEVAPEIEVRENEVGVYVLNAEGIIGIEYRPKPKTQLDLIQEQLNSLVSKTETIAGDGLVNMELNLSLDDKVDEINSKIQ